MEKNRNHTIDVLKGLCIILIIITHFDWKEGVRLEYGFPFWVDMAVPLFMIISGYAYSLSYNKQGIENYSDAYDLYSLVKKITRYTVPYLVTIMIELSIIFFMNIKIPDHYTGFVPGGIMSLIRVIAAGGQGPGSYYYPIMIQFIFVFPVIYFCIKEYNSLGFIFCLILNCVYEVIKTCYELNEDTYRLLLFRYIMLISYGAFLYRNRDKQMRLIIYVPFCIIGICYIVANQYFRWELAFVPYWGGTCFVAGMFLLPLAYMLLSIKMSSHVLETVGKASFNIYLTQMVFFYFYYSIDISALGIYIKNDFIRFLICLAINILVGTLFYIIERPVTSNLIRLIERGINRIKPDSIKRTIDEILLK